MKVGVLIALAMLAFIVMALYTFSISIFGAVDSSTNMTGSPYQEQYNTTQSITRATLSIISFAPLMLGFVALIAVLLWFSTQI